MEWCLWGAGVRVRGFDTRQGTASHAKAVQSPDRLDRLYLRPVRTTRLSYVNARRVSTAYGLGRCFLRALVGCAAGAEARVPVGLRRSASHAATSASE